MEPNHARERRNCRRRAFKKLDPQDQYYIRKNLQNLAIMGLSTDNTFDLIAAIGELMVKKEKTCLK